jgi:hypothetical protein
MEQRRKSLAPALGIVVLLGALIQATGPAAAATGPCAGSRIAHIGAYESGTILSWLNIYWDSSTGKNCARDDKDSAASTYGYPGLADVWLARCSQSTQGNTCTVVAQVEDSQWTYKYYAGPVYMPAAGHCIDSFTITQGVVQRPVDGDLYQVQTSPNASHCA